MNDTFNNYSFGNLVDYVAMCIGQEPIDEYQAEAFERFKRGPEEYKEIQESIALAKRDLNKIPVSVDDYTANQVCALKQYDEKFFDIIVNDIHNAYMWVEGLLRDKFPNWKKLYPLMDINIIQFTEDKDWQHFVQYNELDHLVLPTCAESVMVICLHFKKEKTNLRFRKEIEFLDVICMGSNDTIERLYYLHPTYSLN